MRPIDKGDDLGEVKPYKNAQQLLIDRLGDYCSYCERWIASGIHVEHKKPKNDYPETKYTWSNFLLSCSNCNSGKGHGKLNLDDYLWVDTDNTFRAFIYDSEGRVIPNSIYDPHINDKINNTWLILGLNKHPDSFTFGQQIPSKKDLRWYQRTLAWQKAEKRKQELAIDDTPQRRAEIIEMACERGFFSVWMNVFFNDVDMRLRLITAFKGTSLCCFDNNSQPI